MDEAYSNIIMYPNHVSDLTGLQFSIRSASDTRDQSVLHVTNTETMVDGKPKRNGLYDARMGPQCRGFVCETCEQKNDKCIGHYGHKKLTEAFTNSIFAAKLKKILLVVCMNCHTVICDQTERTNLSKSKIRKGLDNFVASCRLSHCPKCNAPKPDLAKVDVEISHITLEYKTMPEHANQEFLTQQANKRFAWVMTPTEAKAHLSKLSDDDVRLLGMNPRFSRPEDLIFSNITIGPPAIRPRVMARNGVHENGITHMLGSLIKYDDKVAAHLAKNPTANSLTKGIYQRYIYMQSNYLYGLIEGDKVTGVHAGKNLQSLSAEFSGKRGVFRNNLSGKRVDFSGRTVISADPEVPINSIGVPMAIATNLTIPITVTERNLEKMRMLVSAGAKRHPGAKLVVPRSTVLGHTKHTYVLEYSKDMMTRLRIGDVVHRYMMDGDKILFNRQPSLHKQSMMCHDVKVMETGNTFRLNLAATGPYNADFDGDEMNMHLMQSTITQIEIDRMAAVEELVISCAHSSPVMSIIQDSLVGSWLLTDDSTRIDRRIVQELVMECGVDPSTVDCDHDFTGKEMLSVLIPRGVNIHKQDQGDKDIDIVDGTIKPGQGKIDKATLGTSVNGLIHRIWKDIDHKGAVDFMSNIQTMVNRWLLDRGHSIGIDDVYISPKLRDMVQRIIEESRVKVSDILSKIEIYAASNNLSPDVIESTIRQVLRNVRSKVGNIIYESLGDDNQLKAMVKSGSRGDKMNITQTIGALCDQLVAGSRPSKNYNKRTLPCFTRNDDSMLARGFVRSSFFDGLTPVEWFSHCAGGRVGLVDTARKTCKTGYAQRKMIKALEDFKVCYDGTVRNSRGRVLQFQYGYSGIDTVCQENYTFRLIQMDDSQLRSTFLLSDATIAAHGPYTDADRQYVEGRLRLYRQTMQIVFNVTRKHLGGSSVNTSFPIAVGLRSILTRTKNMKHRGPLATPTEALRLLRNFKDLLLSSSVPPYSTGYLEIALWECLCPRKVLETKLKLSALNHIYEEVVEFTREALIDPGSSVGIVAAQSVGEPMTQSTLNTFHKSGIESQETMGVQRFNELLDLQKKQKTVVMRIPVEESETSVRVQKSLTTILLKSMTKTTSWVFCPTAQDIERDKIGDLVYQSDESESQDRMPWVFRIELDRSKLYTSDTSILDVVGALAVYIASQEQDSLKISKKKAKELLRDLMVCGIACSDPLSDRSIVYLYMYIGDENVSFDWFGRFGNDVLEALLVSGYHNKGNDAKQRQFLDKIVVSDTTNILLGEHGVEYRKGKTIVVRGVNLQDITEMKGIDTLNIATNDVHEMYRWFGIEAARQTLIEELQRASEAAARINDQHITVLIDYMTQHAKLTPITRHGINKMDTDVMSRAGFEHTMKVLEDAAFYSEIDTCQSVSSRVMMGQVPYVGSGLSDTLLDTRALVEATLKRTELKMPVSFSGFAPDQEMLDLM